MVEDHSDSKTINLLLPQHGLLFLISTKGSFICTIHQTGQYIIWLLLYYSGALAGRELAKWVQHE